VGWSRVDDLRELVGCEDADVGIRHLHLAELACGGGICCGSWAAIRWCRVANHRLQAGTPCGVRICWVWFPVVSLVDSLNHRLGAVIPAV
jgi:hypothetical protein